MYSQPGIFNVLDYGMVPNLTSAASANTGKLQDAINDAQSKGGGIVLIPSEYYGATIYYLEWSESPGITISGTNPVVLLGTGEATILSVMNSSGTFISASGPTGLVFQDLSIIYEQSTNVSIGTAL